MTWVISHDPPNFWNVENELRHCNCTTHQASSVQWSCGAVVPISIISMFASGCRGGGAEANIHRPGESETRIHNNRTSTREWGMSGKLNTFGNFSAKVNFCDLICAGGCSKGSVEGEESLAGSQGLERKGQEEDHLRPSQDQAWGGGLRVKTGFPKLSKIVKKFPKLSKIVKNCQKKFQSCPKLSKKIQSCPKLSKIFQSCQKLSKKSKFSKIVLNCQKKCPKLWSYQSTCDETHDLWLPPNL